MPSSTFRRRCIAVVIATVFFGHIRSHAQLNQTRKEQLAERYFSADAPWYLRNIPFLEIDDPEIQEVYYYRWRVFRAHIREIGPEGTMLLEFLPDVPWARKPWTDLNDSCSFHLMEGRWLRNPAVINSLIDHLYAGDGNTRGFSEWIAAASVQAAHVSGDFTAVQRNFDYMTKIDREWDDHFVAKRNLYWVEPISDATEYTIASIDASGAGFEDHPQTDPDQNGFTKGFAYRPSINTYQYGNAIAIEEIATRMGRSNVAEAYRRKAEVIQQASLKSFWNEGFQHFMDRYQRSTPFVKEDDFIRGRELVGYTPWLLEMVPRTPEATTKYSAAWSHLLSTKELLGAAGVRTVEPSYPRYKVQYRYEGVRPECQWNGASWPFQTSEMLTGLANLLDDYPSQQIISRNDYVALLRQYTKQHYLSSGTLDLQEDYDPDRGYPIVGLERSHHYEHSTYVDLILSGLIGIRPRGDETLEIAPLLPTERNSKRPIHFFALSGVSYHGHDISLLYDETGEHYHAGPGLTVWVDGTKAVHTASLRRVLLPLPPLSEGVAKGPTMPEDLAVNLGTDDGPRVTASSTQSEQGLKQAIDGRLWFFPETANGWSPLQEPAKTESWIELKLPQARLIGSVELYFLGAGAYRAPADIRLQYHDGTTWVDIPEQVRSSAVPIANGRNQINFKPIRVAAMRMLVGKTLPATTFRLIEWEAFSQPRP